MAASSMSLTSSLHGSWGSSIAGEECSKLARLVPPASVRPTVPIRSSPVAKNGNEGKGLFAPLVVLTRNIIGKKRLNQLRGKSIALHSGVGHRRMGLGCHLGSQCFEFYGRYSMRKLWRITWGEGRTSEGFHHKRVITEFCKAIGADGKQRQGLIQLAKKNGERLGLLA